MGGRRMIGRKEINGLAGGHETLSGLVRLVRAAPALTRTRARVRACPPCPRALQVSEYANGNTDKVFVRPCPRHDATAIGGTDRGRWGNPLKGFPTPTRTTPGPVEAVRSAHSVTPTPFGSFPACRLYGSAMRSIFSVAGSENSATNATNATTGCNMSDRVSRAEAARTLGVSPSTITRLVQANPELLDKTGEVSVAEIIELRRSGQLTVRSARADMDRAKATMAEMDLAERLANTLRRDDVEAAFSTAVAVLKQTSADLVTSHADQLARIGDSREMERALEDLMREFLATAARAMCAGSIGGGEAPGGNNHD